MNNEIPADSITLELGDIIEIIAPSNHEIHEITALIAYIDARKIKMIHVSTKKFYQLNIAEDGTFTDESIQRIYLLNRSEEPGFARQNGLLPKLWVDVYFGGEIPVIVTGEITNLEEDMIEITTYPELVPIYINFGYQGIPEDIPIEKILIRDKPISLAKLGSLSLLRQNLEEGEMYEGDVVTDLANIEYTETGESIIRIPEGAVLDENIRDTLHELYIDANTIVFGEQLGEVAQLVEVPESQRRYGIDVQVNDLMDELLSTIPNSQRTKQVLDGIHMLIGRFKELRSQFSKFDANENAYAPKWVGAYAKPLVDRLERLDRNLRWIIPVISNRRKIYDVDIALDTPDTIVETFAEGAGAIETMCEEYYKNNAKDQTLNYSAMQNRIQSWMNPVNLPTRDGGLSRVNVQADIDVIVDNLEDFYSSVYGNAGIIRRKFVVQRYNLGLTKLEDQILKNGKTVYLRGPMTPNDTAQVKSILMMPAPIMRYSRIDLPSTSIIDKAALHQNMLFLFRLLRKDVDILPHVIQDLSNEFDYDKLEKETKQEFLTGIHEFLLEEDGVYVDEKEKYHKFLETVLPQTRFLVKAVRKYITDQVSFVHVVQALEPYSIYAGDITYKQYVEIRQLIRDQIKDYKQDTEKRGIALSALRNAKYAVSPKPNTILRLLTEKKDFEEAFFQTYSFLSKDNKLGSAEILNQMIAMDNGSLYTTVLSSIMVSLMTPGLLLDSLSGPNVDDMTENEKINPTDCSRRYLAKRYSSLKELQKENNVDEIFYDKEFDDTPYEILQKYKDQQKAMLPDLFLEFLTENLIHMHDCPREIARDLAITMIAKKKRIVDGEYALLEVRPHLPPDIDEASVDTKAVELEAEMRKKIQYYRRLKNNWVKDEEIDDQAFLDTNTLFCNVSKDCIKNTRNKVCEPLDFAAERMQEIAKKKMLSEFDKRYSVQAEELEEELEKNIAYSVRALKRVAILDEIQSRRANNLAYELGNLAHAEELVASPHLSLRNLILGQDDFVKKQSDICRFVATFCRDPLVAELEESAFWMYCKDTNTKLFPLSLYQLAMEFNTGGDYSGMLARVCNDVGILSDDNDAIVDKHSGFVLRKIDFVGEEGFDADTFRLSAQDIKEGDLLVTGSTASKMSARVFENDTTQTIYNVASAICANIDIDIQGIDEFVLRVSSEIIAKEILSAEIYKKKSDANQKKTGKPFKTTYENYRGETMIIIIASMVLIAIQTAVPELQTKHTFPGCRRAFDGYPMDGVENLAGIEYMCCVLNKTKSSVAPWTSIQPYKVDVLVKRMRTILEGHIVKRTDIEELYTKKREYLVLHPVLLAPPEHRIERWQQFLPPLTDYMILKKLHAVASDFGDELRVAFQRGNSTQQGMILTLKSRLIQFGYGLLEAIRDIVKKKGTLLRTSAQIPFVENACCNENADLTRPLEYFIAEDESIVGLVRSAKTMSRLVEFVRATSTAPLFYHAPFTGVRYPTVPAGQLEENIYAAVFWYCNFDRRIETPIPTEYKAVCGEKPAGYRRDWSMLEKMEFFKKNGRQFGLDTLHKLMQIVNNKNLVAIDAADSFSQVDTFKDVIEQMDRMNSTIIERRLRDHLHKVLATYDPKVMRDTVSPELEGLTKYLIFANQNLFKTILEFFDRHRKLSDREYHQVREFLTNITKWSAEEESGHTFIKNAIQNMGRIYPEILKNGAEISKKVPKHWGLSSFHEGDIVKFITKYYQRLEKFKGDRVLGQLLDTVSDRFLDVWLFVQHIPMRPDVVKVVAEGEKPRRFHALFDNYTLNQLMSYCFYSVLYEYILASQDVELLRADVQESKATRRATIKRGRDSAALRSIPEGAIDDENDTLQQVDIIVDDPDVLKGRVCDLLLVYLEIEEDDKKAVDFSYEQIIQRVRRSKEKEKRDIIERLGDMSIEERKVEDMFKNYRLGRWNVGQQAGLIRYDKDTYNRERQELMDQLSGDVDVVNQMRMDIYELENQDEAEADTEGDLEMYDITGLGENFMDGEYYAEDRDPDDDGDYA